MWTRLRQWCARFRRPILTPDPWHNPALWEEMRTARPELLVFQRERK